MFNYFTIFFVFSILLILFLYFFGSSSFVYLLYKLSFTDCLCMSSPLLTPSEDQDKNKDNYTRHVQTKDKLTNFRDRSKIKQKTHKVAGIYLWVNNITQRCYVGKSVNLYIRLIKYLSATYILANESKMAICGAIKKYTIDNFTLFILEVLPTHTPESLSERENYWYKLIMPSYNIQSILQPFTGKNHYRYGKTVPDEVKTKISKTLKGRKMSEEQKQIRVAGSRKKPIYCYEFETGRILVEYAGLRIATRALNLKDSMSIRQRLNKNKPLEVVVENIM
uniref:GIY-YIG endonuclease n=1 Tax=Coniophora olivacea TaxID=85977 RepID=A0A896Z1S3_9AGAM